LFFIIFIYKTQKTPKVILIDILIFILCLGGLIYLITDRAKYMDINKYYKKQKRLFELCEIINSIEADNKKILEQIDDANIYEPLDDKFANKLIQFSDDENKLTELKKEQREVETYLKNARHYKKTLGV